MSGVIDDKGRQWERCNGCGEWTLIQDLGYLRPRPHHPHGLDLCVSCVDLAIRCGAIKFQDVAPAQSWKPVEV